MATAAEMIARYRAQNGTQKEGAAQASSGTTAADMIARYRAQQPVQTTQTTPTQTAQTAPTQTARRVQPIFTPGEQAFSAAGAKQALNTAKAVQAARTAPGFSTPQTALGFSAAQAKRTLDAARDYAMANPNDATKKIITDRIGTIDREIADLQPKTPQEAAVRRAGQIHALGAGDGASREQNAEDALVKEKQSLQGILDGKYGKKDADWLKVLYSMALRGSDAFVSGVASTADMLAGGATKLLLGLTDAEYESLNTPTTAFKNWARKNAEINDAYFTKAAGDSGAARVAGELGAGVVGAVPQAALAILSAGTSMAGQLGTAADGLGSLIIQVTGTMAKSPQYWLSFLQVAGDGYEDAKADGADDLTAMSYGLINGTLNAIVEVGGGGIDALPDNLQQGGKPLLKWVESSLDEGKEEVVQGIIERGFQNLIYGKGNPMFSLTDEDAVINPITSAKEFGGGAFVGGILGAGQAGVSTAINRAARSGDMKQLGAAIREAGAADALIKEAKARGGEAAAMAQRIEGKRGKSAATDAELGELYIQTLGQTQSTGGGGHGREGSIPENAPETAAVTENDRNGTESDRNGTKSSPTTTETAPVITKTAPRTAENPRIGTDGTRYAPRAGEETVLVPLPKAGETQGSKADANEIVSKLRQSLPELRNEPVAASLSGNEFAKGTKKLTEQVGDFFRSLGNSIFRKGFGSVIIDERGVKSDIAHGVGRAKAVTFAAVPAVIENGRQIDYQENWKGRGYDTYVFAAPVRIGNADSYVAVVVRSGADNRFYLHEVIDGDGNLIYKMDASPAIKTGVTAESGITGTGKAPTDGSSVESTIPQTPPDVKSRFTPEGRIYAPRAGEGPVVLPTAEEEMNFRLSRNAKTELERSGILAGVDRETISRAQDIADTLGRDIVFYSSGSAGENGYRDMSTGRIYINAQSKNPTMQIIAHELTHSIEGSSSYDRLKKLILGRIQQQGGDLDELRQAKAELYARHSIVLEGEESIDAEIVAEYIEKNLLTDEESIISLVSEDRTLGRRIMDFIDRILARLGNEDAQERAFLTRAREYYAKALEETPRTEPERTGADDYLMELREQLRAGEITDEEYDRLFDEYYRGGSEGQFSIEETGDGKKYVRADRQVIYGNDPRAWSEQLEDYINGKIRRGQDVTLIGADGDELRLTATTAGKLSDNHTSDGRTMSSEAFERKANAAAHVDELAQVSVRGNRTVNDYGGRHGSMASGGWNYRTAYFEDFDGKYYEIKISVAQSADGSMLYNIGDMKERSAPQKINGSSAAGGGALRGSTSQNFRKTPTSERSSRADSGSGLRGLTASADNVSQPVLPVKRKFSLDEPVERTDTLLALHNMTEEKLRRTLGLGAWPSPSIAIVEAEQGHEKYGEYSAVFPADVIDPQADRRNRVYGSDAWTPTDANARVEYEVDYDARRSIERNIEQLSKKVANGMFSRSSVLGSAGIEDVTDADAKSIAKKLASQDAVKAAYLASRGEDVDIAYKAKEFDSWFGNDALRKYIDKVGPQRLAELYVKLETGERLTPYETLTAENVIRQAYEEKHAGLLNRRPEKKAERIARYMENNVTLSRVEDFIRHAQEYYADSGATTDEIDRMATSDRLNAAAKTSDVEAWVEGQLGGLLGEPGIYNGKDYYTPSGDRRSFAETHWDYNVENIVRAMNNASSRGEGMWDVTGSTLAATATPEYGSIADMHADEGRLRRLDQGEYDRLMEDLSIELDRITDDLMRTTKHHADNNYDERQILGGIIAEAAQGKRTAAAIKQAFRKEGYAISDGHAQSIIRLLDHAAQVPTEYFEAKPQRVVSFDEAVAVVAPDNAPAELIEDMQKAGMNVVEYAAGDEKSRLDTINRLENVRFSISETTDNRPFVEVEQDILAGVPEADWVKTVKENLKKKFPNGITVGNNEIRIDKQSRREMTFSRYMQQLYNRDPQLHADKLRATDNADEILHAATDWVNEGAKHPRRDNIRDFARGEVLLRVGGNDYTADVVVGTRENGSMLLYDILNLRPTSFTKKETDAAITVNPSPGAGRNTASVSNDSISSANENVNSQFSVSERTPEEKKEIFRSLQGYLNGKTDARELRRYVDSLDESIDYSFREDSLGLKRPRLKTAAEEEAERIVRRAHGEGVGVEEYLRRSWDEYEVDGRLSEEARKALELERRQIRKYSQDEAGQERTQPDTGGQDDTRAALPRKAQDYLRRTERTLVNRIGRAMSVPRLARRDYLEGIAREISGEYLRDGRISEETAQRLFDTAYDEGVIVDEEFYNQYKDLKDRLRTMAVTISEKDKADIADFNSFRKSAFGRLRIVNEGGMPVDVAYEELRAEAPELFPSELTHPADQLVRMFEAAQSIERSEKSLDEHFGYEADEFKRWAKGDFDAAINDTLSELRNIRRFAEEGARAEEPAAIATQEEVKEAYKQLKEARRAYEKAEAKNLLTHDDEMQVGRLLRGETELRYIDPRKNNFRGIKAVYEAKREYEKYAKTIRDWNESRRAELRKTADELLKTANSWKDKKAGILYARETMERNIYDIVKDRKLAKRIIDEYFTPVHTAQAQSTRLKNRMRDRVRRLDLSTTETKAMQREGKVSEAHAVQLIGEAMDNIRMLENSRGRMKERDGKTLEDWRSIVRDLWVKNPQLDRAKIEGAVEEFRGIYDELFEMMNETRLRNGYEPVNYRKGYFPHFQPGDGDGIMGLFGRALGIDTQVTALPTTINGLTHTFRPGIQWFSGALERRGFETAYNAVEGFDRYIEGVADVIYQTDNIQKLRALATQVRYRTGDEGIKKQVDAVRADTSLSEEDRQNRIDQIYKDGRFALSNFAVELEEYTNLLANKKSRADRNMEQALGRNMYNLTKALESRIAANMVAVNVGSWLTNYIPLTQGGAQLGTKDLLHGMWQTLRDMKTSDGVIDASTFLTNRRGSDPLVRTWSQKASAVLSSPMEHIDQFTAGSLVRARYNQNRRHGLSESEAMSEADSWAASVMADRSKGSTPTLFNRKNPITKLLTQFQLEVNNQLSYLFKDMPREQLEKGVGALALALFKFCLGAWLYDEIYEYFIGRRPALDPIGILNDTVGDLTGYELPNLVELGIGAATGNMPSFETEKTGVGEALKNLGENVAGELPFTALLPLLGINVDGGRIPISNALPNAGNLYEAATNEGWSAKKKLYTAGKELSKPATYLIPPFGGGQVRKIYQGLEAVIRGGSYSMDSEGNEQLQYPVYTDTPLDTAKSVVQSTLFGKTALPGGREWIDSGFKSFSAKQTAVYKGLLDAGVGQKEAYRFIKDMGELGKTDDESAATAKRAFLESSGLSGEGKSVVYYGLLASDREREAMDGLAGMGADMGAVTQTLISMKAAGDKDSAKLKALSEAGLGDEETIELAGLVMGTELVTESGAMSQYAKLKACVDAGMSAADALKAKGEGARLDKLLELADAGLEPEAAERVALALAALEPEEGKTQVSDAQRWRAALDAAQTGEEEMNALKAVMDERQFAKLGIARDYGIDPELFVSLKEVLPQFDENENGSINSDELEAAIDAMGGGLLPAVGRLTQAQQAALWQIYTTSTDPTKNPFGVGVGRKVQKAKEAAMEEIKAREKGK